MTTHFFGIDSRLFIYSHTVGRKEDGGPGFRSPRDLAIGPGGTIYIVNRSPEERTQGIRVTMCTVDEEFLGQFGGYGEGKGEFIWPASIALDGRQNVYVADEWLGRISVFDQQGHFLDRWGVKGTGTSELARPCGLAFDGDDHLYVVDGGTHQIKIFTPEGRLLGAFGNRGSGSGEFNSPWGIAIGDEGSVYVADWGNDRIQKFTHDGQFLGKFGSSGNQMGEFTRPTGVAVDGDGDIYVVDWANHRVQVFTRDWRHLTTLSGDATLSKLARQKLEANPSMVRQLKMVRDQSDWRRFSYPIAVKLDGAGNIFIADAGSHRIQVYQKERVAEPLSS